MNKKETKIYHINIVSIFIIRFILWFPALLFVHFLLRMKVEGKKNLGKTKSGKVIFAANHSSEIDPYAFQYTLSFFSRFVPLYFVSLSKKYYPYKKFKIRSYIYGGLFFRLMGAYPVYKGLHDFKKAFCNHIEILNRGHSILMFPEGKMVTTGEGDPKPGIIFLAKETNAEIVPVKIEGTSNLKFTDIIFMRKRIIIKFGNPIDSDVFTGADTNTLSLGEMKMWAEFIMKKIVDL